MHFQKQLSFITDQQCSRTSLGGETCMKVNAQDLIGVENSSYDLTAWIHSGGERKVHPLTGRPAEVQWGTPTMWATPIGSLCQVSTM